MIKIDGKQISIRDWNLKDIEVYQKWNTGHHLWKDFNGPYYPKMTATELEEKLAFIKSKIETNTFKSPRRTLPIATLESNILIGTVNWYWQSIETNWLSAGLVIYDEQMWSKNIGYEALGIWCQYLFDEMPEIPRIDLRTFSENKGMMRLAEKLGFQLEAVFRKARVVKGMYCDSIGYGILREEWREKYPDRFTKSLI